MPYEVKITEKPSEETKTQIINELKELRSILEEYKDKTIEVNMKRILKKGGIGE